MEPIVDENDNVEDIIFDDESFQITENSETSLNNLWILGKVWIQALKTVLLGANFSLIPVVYAGRSPPPKDPAKPPKMKYIDLPLYATPHADYKEFAKTTSACPKANVKVFHSILLPYVTRLREKSVYAFSAASCTAKCTLLDGIKSIRDSKNQVKQYMRDPKNLQIRQGVVAGGTLIGYVLGGGGGVPKRVIHTGLGALAAGSLCFPKETDATFKDVLYRTKKLALAFYQTLCRKPGSVERPMPCKSPNVPKTKSGKKG